MKDSPIVQEVLEFVRTKLAEFEKSGSSGLIGVDIPITNGEPTGGINTRQIENRKAIKVRDRFG